MDVCTEVGHNVISGDVSHDGRGRDSHLRATGGPHWQIGLCKKPQLMFWRILRLLPVNHWQKRVLNKAKYAAPGKFDFVSTKSHKTPSVQKEKTGLKMQKTLFPLSAKNDSSRRHLCCSGQVLNSEVMLYERTFTQLLLPFCVGFVKFYTIVIKCLLCIAKVI